MPKSKKIQARTRVNVVIDCTNRPEVREGLDRLFESQPDEYRKRLGVTRHRLAMTALRLGIEQLETLAAVKVREKMSELSPVGKKHWDEGAKKWL